MHFWSMACLLIYLDNCGKHFSLNRQISQEIMISHQLEFKKDQLKHN